MSRNRIKLLREWLSQRKIPISACVSWIGRTNVPTLGDAEGGADGETVRDGVLLETMEGTMEADTDGAMEGDTDGARDGVLLGADEGAAVVGAGNRTKHARERRFIVFCGKQNAFQSQTKRIPIAVAMYVHTEGGVSTSCGWWGIMWSSREEACILVCRNAHTISDRCSKA